MVVGRRADERQREVYEVVRAAQIQAISQIRAGMTGREADDCARSIIGLGGFGEAFGHALGHGVGLEVHEAPRLSCTNDDPLPAGCVVTVEPGVYLPGWGGVRIEDDIHVTDQGGEVLTDGRTELLELV
jgi:Xaa-Pro aminopeptidase